MPVQKSEFVQIEKGELARLRHIEKAAREIPEMARRIAAYEKKKERKLARGTS